MRVGCWFAGCSWEETAPHWDPPKKKEVKQLSRFIGLWVAVVHVTVVFTEDLVGLR